VADFPEQPAVFSPDKWPAFTGIRNKKKGIKENVYEWLNYRQKMTSQYPKGFYNVLYNTSGTNLTAFVLNNSESTPIEACGLTTRGFVADAKTYVFQTDKEDEAHFLCAILNSKFVNDTIKPYQTRGIWGERDIHRRPFEKLSTPIPEYEPLNVKHRQLVDLSIKCHQKVDKIKGGIKAKAIGLKRTQVRSALQNELSIIDKIVSDILSGEKQ
jgi:hypothetical protein